MHKNKKVKDISSNEGWEFYGNNLSEMKSKMIIVPPGMEARPALISHHVYGIPDYWWVICVANRIIDPFEQLVEGAQIKIPLLLR
jgi:hypothetical protein